MRTCIVIGEKWNLNTHFVIIPSEGEFLLYFNVYVFIFFQLEEIKSKKQTITILQKARKQPQISKHEKHSITKVRQRFFLSTSFCECVRECFFICELSSHFIISIISKVLWYQQRWFNVKFFRHFFCHFLISWDKMTLTFQLKHPIVLQRPT